MPVGAATVRESVAVWLSEPDWPWITTLEVPIVALAAAVSVKLCGVPGVRVSVAGATVTPVGRPEIETLTELVKPFNPVAETAVC